MISSDVAVKFPNALMGGIWSLPEELPLCIEKCLELKVLTLDCENRLSFGRVIQCSSL